MTIKKANFATMSVTMLAILFLFQFCNISVLYTSNATINHAAETESEFLKNQTLQTEDFQNELNYNTAVIGAKNNPETAMAAEWCVYQKRTYGRFSSLKEFNKNISTNCKFLIVNADVVQTNTDIQILSQTCKYQIHIIFTSLPEQSLLKHSEKLRTLLGIKQITSEAFPTNGVTLFEGFLLGGKTSYKKMKLTVPYFKLQSGSKVYMVGNIKDQKEKKIKNEDLPPIIWRYRTGQNFLFAVNADFFKSHTGLGILTAMSAETEDYTLYPVVNAQCLLCQNYPYLSNENSETIAEKYYYSTQSFSQNVLWPDITSILNATGEKFSGMIAPKFEYGNTLEGISTDTISFYYKQTEQVSGTLGLSGDQIEENGFYDAKLQYDTDMFEQKVPSYIFTIFSPGQMPESVYRPYLNGEKPSILSNIRTLVKSTETPMEPLLSFYNEAVLSMSMTNDGFSHTDEEDFYLKSIETALGYSLISLEFLNIYYPDSTKDEWTRLSKNLSRYLKTYWAEYRKAFDQVTINEADQNARRFFALDYQSSRKDDTINLSIHSFQKEASFLLRLSNEKITSMSGASYQKIEKNTYMIRAFQQSVTFTVADDAKG